MLTVTKRDSSKWQSLRLHKRKEGIIKRTEDEFCLMTPKTMRGYKSLQQSYKNEDSRNCCCWCIQPALLAGTGHLLDRPVTVVTTEPLIQTKTSVSEWTGGSPPSRSQSSSRKTATTNSWSLEECSRYHETKSKRKRRGHATEGRTIKKILSLSEKAKRSDDNQWISGTVTIEKNSVKTHRPNLPPKPKSQPPTPRSPQGQKKQKKRKDETNKDKTKTQPESTQTTKGKHPVTEENEKRQENRKRKR